jgi:hypothetical protein
MAYINRLSDINNRLDISIENQTTTNNKLSNIDDNIETIRALNNNITTQLDTLHTDITDTNTKLDTLHTDITDTNTKLDTLHTDITDTNTKLDTLHTDITTIHGDLTDTNTKLDTIHADLDGLTFDGSSNLNVNVASGSISVSSANIKDSSGNNLNSTSNALNSYITNGSTTNSTITNAGTGLNIYSIPSKTKTFLFNAYSNNTATNAAIGSFGNTQSFNSFNFGIANPRSTWTVYRTSSSGAGTAFNFRYTYINAFGNEVVGTPVTLTTAGVYNTLAPGIVTINSWSVDSSFTQFDSLYINLSLATTATAFGGANLLLQNNSLWTCPNNCIAWVQNVNFYGSGAESVRLVKWDATGVRSIMFSWLNASNFSVSSTGEYGFGGYITAGETIGWGGENASIVRNISANIVCRYL